jgi:putative membrane protein
VHKGLRFLLVAALAALIALPMAAAADVATHGDRHHKVSHQDKMFMTDAAEGALFEVQAGALAAKKGASPQTRAFGRRMVRDHSREYAELARLAHQLDVDIPDEPSEQQQQAIALWRQLSGKAFDCAYIPYEVVDHMLDIEHNKGEVEQGHNPKVRHFAARWLPVLQSHLDQAEEVLADLHTC